MQACVRIHINDIEDFAKSTSVARELIKILGWGRRPSGEGAQPSSVFSQTPFSWRHIKCPILKVKTKPQMSQT